MFLWVVDYALRVGSGGQSSPWVRSVMAISDSALWYPIGVAGEQPRVGCWWSRSGGWIGRGRLLSINAL